MILSCLYKHVVFGVGCQEAKPNSDGEFQVSRGEKERVAIAESWVGVDEGGGCRGMVTSGLVWNKAAFDK